MGKTKKQPWGPLLRNVLAPNVPWAWYAANTAANMAISTMFVGMSALAAQIMTGAALKNTSVLLQYLGVNLFAVVTSLALGLSGAWADFWTERKIQDKLWVKLVRMPMSVYDQQPPSSLISRVTTDTSQITYSLSFVCTLVTHVYTMCLVLHEIWVQSHFIALALLLVLPYAWVVMVLPGRLIFRVRNAAQQKFAELTTFVAERLGSITLVKSAACEDTDLALGYAAVDEHYRANLKYWLLDGATQPFTYGTEGIVGAIVLVAGSILVSRGEMDMTGLVYMFMLRQTIYTTMTQFIFCFYNLKNTQGSTVKITQFLSDPSEVLEREKSFTQPDSDIVFDNVSFRYADRDVIQNITAVIPKGKVTAIVGPSGAGKTTLLNLLERLYTPGEGEIRFGDTPVEKIHLDQWRGAFGYIQQASPLFSGTIRSNIVYGLNRPATEEEVIRAAKMANAYDFIMKLPAGFDTDVGQLGSKLSGGERQRIAIARMIIKDPDYLLLDEATSNLDGENEAQVQSALTNMMQGRTAIVVAHNLRTVIHADNIIVMAEGRIQAVGTHESLYRHNDLYTRYFDLTFAPGGAEP